jgi:hypothetical protein
VSVLFDALDEHMGKLKHHPEEFTPAEARALEGLYDAFHLEAQYRGILY